jgi:FAD/FMN-containing dehydrogenase
VHHPKKLGWHRAGQTPIVVAMTTTTHLGEFLRPGDDDYDAVRRVWNGTIDRQPAMIARCRSTAEVAAAVRMATGTGLEIAVRGGGHSIPGLSVCEGGLMIDLSPMKGLDVDVAHRTTYAQPGLLWGEYDAGTQAFGLASPGGEVSHTGVAGLTLGGGIGWLSRRYGLACDNLLGAEVVLADGTIVDADDESTPDLMWALRGGGGNFGIVTEFRFRVHPVPALYAGMMMWPASEAARVLELFCAVAPAAPRDLSLVCAQLVAPPEPFVPAELQLRPAVAIAAIWTGADHGDGARAVAPFRAAAPMLDLFDVQPYQAIQQWFDAGVPHGRRYHVRSEWLDELDGAAVDELVACGASASSPFNQVLVRRLGGAISDVAPDDTAFRFRDARYLLTIAAGWDDGADEPHVDWSRRSWDRLHPWSSGGGYVNHLAADEGAERVRQAYGDTTWRRLRHMKRRYDPTNTFHLNQNIDPT